MLIVTEPGVMLLAERKAETKAVTLLCPQIAVFELGLAYAATIGLERSHIQSDPFNEFDTTSDNLWHVELHIFLGVSVSTLHSGRKVLHIDLVYAILHRVVLQDASVPNVYLMYDSAMLTLSKLFGCTKIIFPSEVE